MNDKNHSSKTLKTLVFGAALGAAAYFLSNKKNRDKAKQKVEDFKENIKTLNDSLGTEDNHDNNQLDTTDESTPNQEDE